MAVPSSISFSLGWCALGCLSRACVQEIKSLFWFSRLVTGTCLALYSWENQIFILLLFVGLQVATHKVAAFRVTRQVLPLIFLQCCSALGFLRLGKIQSSVAGKLAFWPRYCSSQDLTPLCAFGSVLSFSLKTDFVFPDLLRVLVDVSRYCSWVIGLKYSSFF
jgi:hypothetical protein